MTQICSYRMTDDQGFAPNPYGGVLTLATCKPLIRRLQEPGLWVAGWCGSTLNKKHKEELVYLSKVTEKLPLTQYFYDERFQEKRPRVTREEMMTYSNLKNWRERKAYFKHLRDNKYHDNIYGDNIYYKGIDGHWIQEPNLFHFEEEMSRDVSGEAVLICKESYYFGKKNTLKVSADCMPVIPATRGHVFETDQEKIERFLAYVKAHKDLCKPCE